MKRSRFIGEAQRVDSREAVDAAIAALWKQHPDARHIVHGYAIGDEKNELLGMSDDGEPHGTAGRPVMEVLKGSGIRNCLITVVRYFGGTKLGTGGLVHAYGDTAKGCLAELPVEEKRDLVAVALTCPYEIYDALRQVLDRAQAVIVAEDFGTVVVIECAIDRAREEHVRMEIYDVSRGTIELTRE